MNAAVPGKILLNPFDGVELPRVPTGGGRWRGRRSERPNSAPHWTSAIRGRGRARQGAHSRRAAEVWAVAGPAAVPVMVWLPVHAGQVPGLPRRDGRAPGALFSLDRFLRTSPRRGPRPDVDRDRSRRMCRLRARDRSAARAEDRCGHPRGSASATRRAAVAGLAERSRRPTGSAGVRTGPTPTLVFTREDGTAVPGSGPASGSRPSPTAPGLPPCAFTTSAHARRLMKAAEVDTKLISGDARPLPDELHGWTVRLVFPEVAEGRRRGRRGGCPAGGSGDRSGNAFAPGSYSAGKLPRAI